MSLISLQNITLHMGGKDLLQNCNLTIEQGERVCLTGYNGAGKSSLLAMIAGLIEPDSGSIILSEPKLGIMPQNVPTSWNGSVFNVVVNVLGEEGKLLSSAHEATGSQNSTLPLGDATWERYNEVLGVINHLDLQAETDFSSLSGGSKRRVALARAILCSQDLILDEPTNHLDIITISWLEEYLLRKARTLLFVSHDRTFISRLATRVVEVDRGQLYKYDCNYEQYLERREERLLTEEKHFALFDKKLAKEEAWIRQGVKARRTRNMGRVRALKEMRKEHRARRERQGDVQMFAQEAERSGKLVIETSNLGFAYPNQKPIFTGFSTIIQRGDRIGFVGNNGTGKSTLLKVILGELSPTEGTIKRGTHLQISYFDQLRETLDLEKNVMDNVADGNDTVIIEGNSRHVAGYLQDFLFTPDKLRMPVKALSGGERNRLLLAKLFTRPSNLLVLDEPTNDLDVETLELLEELLSNYSGTVLLVSHDRTFLDNLVTSIFALEGDGRVHEYVGAYTDWLRQKQTTAKKEKAINEEKKKQTVQNKPKKLSFNEQREKEQLTIELSAMPDKIASLEKEQQELELNLADPELFSKNSLQFTAITERLSLIEQEQENLLVHWEAIEHRLKQLES